MKLIFYVSIIIVSVGGATYLLIRHGEHDDRLTEKILKLFTILGSVLIGWGVYFYYSGITIWSSFRGPINGGQLAIVGMIISFFSGFQAIKLKRKNKKG